MPTLTMSFFKDIVPKRLHFSLSVLRFSYPSHQHIIHSWNIHPQQGRKLACLPVLSVRVPLESNFLALPLPRSGMNGCQIPSGIKKKKTKPFLPEAASFNSQSTWLIYICEGHGTSVKEVKNGTAHVRGCLKHLGMMPNK